MSVSHCFSASGCTEKRVSGGQTDDNMQHTEFISIIRQFVTLKHTSNEYKNQEIQNAHTHTHLQNSIYQNKTLQRTIYISYVTIIANGSFLFCCCIITSVWFSVWQVRKAKSTQKEARATHSQDKYRQGPGGEVVEVGEQWGPEGFRIVESRLIWKIHKYNSLCSRG